MISQRKAANALSGKTARPCDGCSRKRARWFCVADYAFLCQSCDDSVHSANPLADRHDRVRLETASFKPTESSSSPTWHQGFTKKARTPRHNKFNQVKDGEKIAAMNSNSVPFVPEIEESSIGDEDEDDLIYRVPVFDPFSAELCNSHVIGREEESSVVFGGFGGEEKCDDLGNLQGFLPSDVDLAEFAADVENLLGKGLDDEDFKLLDCKEENDDDEKFDVSLDKKVKDEQEMEEIIDSHLNHVFGFGNESMDWSFGHESPGLARIDEDQVEQKVVAVVDDGDAMAINGEEKKETKKRPSLLRLNYDAIINAWASQGSPWTTGNRPQIDPDDCLPNSMDGWLKDGNFPYGGGRRESNGAREARVLRYKEKRRTRLFSKKIRYEVRKLNAEKRPRMKGRFVKRTSFMPTSALSYDNK